MARFRSIALRGTPPRLTLRFGDDDPLFDTLGTLKSEEVRGLLGLETLDDIRQAADSERLTVNAFVQRRLATSLTRRSAALQSRHYEGWAVTSLDPVRDLVRSARPSVVLDPFGGRASYPVAAAQMKLRAEPRIYFTEISRLFQFLSSARIGALLLSPDWRARTGDELRDFAGALQRTTVGRASDLLTRSAEGDERPEALASEVASFLVMYRETTERELSPAADQLARAAVLEVLLRSGSGAALLPFVESLRVELRRAAEFVEQEPPLLVVPGMIASDARTLDRLRTLEVDLVVTNPPSLNFASYSNATGDWFLRLHRRPVDRTLDPEARLREVWQQLGNGAEVKRARSAVAQTVRAVTRADERAGRTALSYFVDMARAFCALRTHLTSGATVALFVRASSLSGVAVDTPELLGLIVQALGGFRVSSRDESSIVLRR